jgi:small nuclear ribonucleoprotein (snRNP)-like protein
LASLDGYMNIVLENVEENKNGEVINKYDHIFLRGNNGIFYIIF